ncbi:Late embryogenesis abundant protein [Musa troglodytarum]|uniref:Late embryogenesis abundant protein n=1 Tax=Musa troglodytarum TaxID=320322 RepID=A0A9E7EJ98_9LILI|nr:Late embryogenesis abundant protein [Musa troglodytarum]
MTSQAASSPPQSPSRYMTSPTHSHHDADGVSIVGSSPGASPLHPNYHHHLRYGSSPIQHFRDSSASLKHASSWRKIHNDHQHAHYHHGAASSDFSESDDDDDDGDGGVGGGRVPVRCFAAWFALGSILLFTLFSLVLWGASKSYKPAVFVKVRTSPRRDVPELPSPSGNGRHGGVHQDALHQLDGQYCVT